MSKNEQITKKKNSDVLVAKSPFKTLPQAQSPKLRSSLSYRAVVACIFIGYLVIGPSDFSTRVSLVEKTYGVRKQARGREYHQVTPSRSL